MWPGVTVPTDIRRLNDDEWKIVTRVFGADTLPFHARVFITNGLGLNNVPFTIPTSAISTVYGTASAFIGTFALSGPLALVPGAVAAAGGYAASVVNMGFLMNVGPGAFPDMSVMNRNLLVHEMTHVWQGRNDFFALRFVVGSLIAQCGGIQAGGGFSGRNAAYGYDPAHLRDWSDYNPEQQAMIVEDWFTAGEPTTGDIYTKFIQNRVRVGKT
jgi:hypothetical protein